MPLSSIPFKDTGYFSNLMCDYLAQKPELKSFYKRFPSMSNLQLQLEEKQLSFSKKNREILYKSLKNQCSEIEISEKVKANIASLKDTTTFTITTGHQLNLFTGPLYFLYKIINTINLTEEAKQSYPEYNFVPIYWMATEDHDFLEINHFTVHDKQMIWNKKEGLDNANGYVGEYNTHGLEELFSLIKTEFGAGENADYLSELFKKGYLKHDNLAEATRYIVNQLFGEYGLVIIDGNDRDLKSMFIPMMEQELINQTSLKEVTNTSEKLHNLGYKAQVTPRNINLFYGIKGLRERIVLGEDGKYEVINTDIHWNSFKEIQNELYLYPERFSPNVILRPIYQEVILPNLCYIGGGGELAYWLQIKKNFESFGVLFPMLLLRNSALLISKKEQQKAEKLSIKIQELFMKQPALINYKIRQISDIKIDFSEQKKALEYQFETLLTIANRTDNSFLGAVKAQRHKQLKGLLILEKRLLKAQKRKLADHVNRLEKLQNELFPYQSLQERNCNFSTFYLEYGTNLIKTVKQELKPLSMQFNLIYFDS